MIYGIIPVGGIGSRLGLPFPKELIPLKNFNFYYPICKFTVDNMLNSGCEKIFFVHGELYKEQIKQYFFEDKYVHILNKTGMFSKTISIILENIVATENDIFLYGLPDSIYDENLFLKMKDISGIVCGMFKTNDNCKVDRINLLNKFDVKSIKNNKNSVFFWGILKFDYFSIIEYENILEKTKYNEVGNILNNMNFNLIYSKNYLDLGTWENLNYYWNKNDIY